MADALRFVVQGHETAGSVHWDLMLEQDEALATWQVPLPPEQIGTEAIAAERIFDHPKRFLTYEGPLRSHPGRVRIHDRGTYSALMMSDNEWVVSVEGELMCGVYRLERQAGPCPAGTRNVWTIVRVRQ